MTRGRQKEYISDIACYLHSIQKVFLKSCQGALVTNAFAPTAIQRPATYARLAVEMPSKIHTFALRCHVFVQNHCHNLVRHVNACPIVAGVFGPECSKQMDCILVVAVETEYGSLQRSEDCEIHPEPLCYRPTAQSEPMLSPATPLQFCEGLVHLRGAFGALWQPPEVPSEKQCRCWKRFQSRLAWCQEAGLSDSWPSSLHAVVLRLAKMPVSVVLQILGTLAQFAPLLQWPAHWSCENLCDEISFSSLALAILCCLSSVSDEKSHAGGPCGDLRCSVSWPCALCRMFAGRCFHDLPHSPCQRLQNCLWSFHISSGFVSRQHPQLPTIVVQPGVDYLRSPPFPPRARHL